MSAQLATLLTNTPIAGERFDLRPEDVIAICERIERRWS